MHWDLESGSIIVAYWTFGAAVGGAVVAWLVGSRANELQHENNRLERRNGDLQANILTIETERDARTGPVRRATIATAMLADLYVVEDYFFNAYSDAQPSAFDLPMRTAMFDRLPDFVDLFPAETLQALGALTAHLARIPHHVDAIRLASAGASERHPPTQTWMIRVMVSGVLRLTERARERLIADGGTPVEEERHSGTVYPNAPALPPRIEAKLDWPPSHYGVGRPARRPLTEAAPASPSPIAGPAEERDPDTQLREPSRADDGT